MGLLILAAWQIYRAYSLHREHKNLLERIGDIKTGARRTEESIETVERQAKEIKTGNVLRITYANLAIAIFFVLLSIVDISQEIYIHNAAWPFAQLLRIDGPFVTVDHERKIISHFAQIHSAHEYGVVIDELESIAKENKQQYPKFSQW